jgi:hypothetical protein
MRLRRQVLLIAAGLMSVLVGPDESAVAASGRYEPGQYLTLVV